jgi:uncharacterized protein (TIGR00288 family)
MLDQARPKFRIAVLVDSENVRRTLQLHYPGTSLDAVIRELRAIEDYLGVAAVRTVYGDFAINPEHSRLYQRAGFQPMLVLRKESGSDRSDMEMALDAHEILLGESDIDGFLFVTGDADFLAVLRRVRRKSRKAFVAGFSVTMARELLGEADQPFAIDARMGLIAGRVPEAIPEGLDVARLIRALDNVLSRLPFVHYRYFRDQIITADMGAGDDPNTRNTTLSSLINQGVLALGKQPNRDGTSLVNTLELVRDHPVVIDALLGNPELLPSAENEGNENRALTDGAEEPRLPPSPPAGDVT